MATPPGQAASGYFSPSSLIALSVVLPVVDIVVVGLRFYARRKQHAPLQWDDWLVIPALILIVGMGASMIVGVAGHGLGYATPPSNIPGPNGHAFASSPEHQLSNKIEWFNLMTQPLVLGCIKISIICFYGRIFDAKRRGLFHTILCVLIGLIVVWIVAFFFAMLFLCGASPSAFWGPYIVTLRTCSDGHYLWILEAFAYTDFLFDVAVFFLPIPKIWSLHMPVRRRLLVTAVFAVGASAIVGSILRLVIVVAGSKGITDSIASQDGIILVSQLLFWNMLETGLALVAACLPTINFLFGRLNPTDLIRSVRSALSLNSLRSSQRSRGSGNGSGGSKGSRARRSKAQPNTADDAASHSSQTRFVGDRDAITATAEDQRDPGNKTIHMRDAGERRQPLSGGIHVSRGVHVTTT